MADKDKLVTLEDLGVAYSDVKSDLTHVYAIEPLTDNIENPSAEVIGSIKSNGDIDTTATSYSASDFIELEANTDYTFTNYTSLGVLAKSRKYVALYDSFKVFVSGSYQNVTGQNEVSFNSSTAKYVRVSSDKTNLKFVKKGSTAPTAFVEYNAGYTSKLLYGDESVPFSAVVLEPINLYDSSTDVNGIISVGGLVEASGSYKTTDYIPVKNGFSYTISPRCRTICAFDANKNADSSKGDNVEKTAPYVFNSTFDGYIRISYNVNYGLTFVKSDYDGTLTKKIPEGVSLSNTQLSQVEDVALSPNILYGKKWAVCGDSFTASGGTGTTISSGKYVGKPYTYPWIIGNRHNMDIVQFFGGGRTLAFPAIPDTFKNSLTCTTEDYYYQNIPGDVDYITIYLGINDEHHAPSGSVGDGEDTTGEIPLGTISDSTTATYYGAWNVVLTWLIENRPNAHIGIIVTNGIAENDNYRQAQIAIAQKYGIPYIDMNGDSRTPAMLRTSNPNISSAVKQMLIDKWSVDYPSNQHPNDAAQLYESTFIENFLRSI